MDIRNLKDRVARRVMFLFCLGVLSLALLMALQLYRKAQPILATRSLSSVLFSSNWHPTQGNFGLASFMMGTLWVVGIAMVIAIPISVLTAIYLAEYAHVRIREAVRPLVDLLAGISPVIYGVWGVVAIVPLVRDSLMPLFSERFPFSPFVSDNYTGFSALSGGIVLAVMVFPVLVSVVQEVLQTVPREIREASLALGATKWQTVKHVVLRKSKPGLIAAIILAVSRASGETIAVLMVAGCALHRFPKSIFDTAYPLPALIANTYGEMMSIPLYDSAILLAAFILFLATTLFNMVGWGILLHLEREGGAHG